MTEGDGGKAGRDLDPAEVQAVLDRLEEELRGLDDLAVASAPWMCRCGHLQQVHEHWRPGEDCSQCDCKAFRRRHVRRNGRLWWLWLG